MDLRFADKDEEAMFKLSLEPELKRSIFLLVPILLVIFALTALRQFVLEVVRPDDSFAFSIDDPRTLRFGGSMLGLVIFPVALMMATMLSKRYRYFEVVNWESFSVLIPTFANICLCFCNRSTTAAIFNRDPHDVYFYRNDSGQNELNGSLFTILLMDVVTTCVCLFVPIRMCFKWIPAVSSVISLALNAALLTAPYPLLIVMFILGTISTMSLRGAWSNERAARQSFIAQRVVKRKSREQRIMHAGAAHLLDRLCDASVELEHDLNICEPSPRLAALLLQSEDSRSLEGTNFLDCLALDEDRDRLRTALHFADTASCESADFDQSGGMVQLSMRDAYGRAFAAYVYHTRIFYGDGACGHLVALVEVQEREPPAALTSINHHGEVQKDAKQNDCGSNAYSDACFSGHDAVVPLVNGDPNEVSVWIDLDSEGLTITKYSIGFTIFGPISVGSGLSDMIPGNVDKFREWCQRVEDQKMKHSGKSEVQPYHLRLQPSPDKRIEFRSTCVPKFQNEDSAYCNGNDRLLCILLSDVVCRSRRSSRTRHGKAQQDSGRFTQGYTSDHRIVEDSVVLSSLDQFSVSSSEDVSSNGLGYFTVRPSFRVMLSGALSGRLALLDYSNTFGALFGPSVQLGYSFEKWFKRCDLERFSEFVGDQMDKHENAEGFSSQAAAEHLEISIYPPHLKPFKVCVCARLSVQPAYRKEDLPLLSDNGWDFPVLAILEHLDWKPKTSSALPKGAASSSRFQASISL